jgi:SAM-dependent methyltransferase
MTGMDASPEMIAIARRKLTRSPAPSILVQGRAQDLPFAGGSIDTVVCTFPAPFVLEPQTLRECARVLRPDSAGNRSGRIVILGLWVDLDAGDWKYVLPVFYGPPPASLLSELARNLEAAGFRARIAEVADDPFRIGVVTADLNAALQ